MARTIVFDFDGTLVDTKGAYVEMITRAFKRFGLKVKSEEVSQTLVPTIKGTIERMLMRSKNYQAKLVSNLEQTTIELLSTRWVKNVKVNKDIIAILDDLRENGHKLYLATNSPSTFVLPVINKFELDKYFEDIITLDSGYKSKSEMLRALARKRKHKVTELVYVADTIMDVELAKEVGCQLVVVLTPRSWDYDKMDKLAKHANGQSNVTLVKGIKNAQKVLSGI